MYTVTWNTLEDDVLFSTFVNCLPQFLNSTHWFQTPVGSSNCFRSGTTAVTWPRSNIPNFAYICNARPIACAVMEYKMWRFRLLTIVIIDFSTRLSGSRCPSTVAIVCTPVPPQSRDDGPKNRKNTHSVSDSDSYSTLPHGSNTFAFPVNEILWSTRFQTPVGSSNYFRSGTTAVTWPRANIPNFAYICNARPIACAVMEYKMWRFWLLMIVIIDFSTRLSGSRCYNYFTHLL